MDLGLNLCNAPLLVIAETPALWLLLRRSTCALAEPPAMTRRNPGAKFQHASLQHGGPHIAAFAIFLLPILPTVHTQNHQPSMFVICGFGLKLFTACGNANQCIGYREKYC